MKARTQSLRKIRATLEKRRDAMRKRLAVGALELKTLAHDVGDSIDAALDAEHLEIHSQLTAAESRELVNIENALERIAAKQFGKCEECGQDIPLARLEALPYATQCIHCQRAGESAHEFQPRSSLWRTLDEPIITYDLPPLNSAESAAY